MSPMEFGAVRLCSRCKGKGEGCARCGGSGLEPEPSQPPSEEHHRSSQCARLLAILREHPEGITSLEALKLIDSLRLAARISDLRADGHEIETEMVTLPNGKRIARYTLREP